MVRPELVEVTSDGRAQSRWQAPFEAPFSDVGTPADYLQASLDLAALEGDRLCSGKFLSDLRQLQQ